MNAYQVLAGCFILLFITPIYSADHYHSPRRVEITYTFDMMIEAEGSEASKNAGYWLLLPTNGGAQNNIQYTSIVPTPEQWIPDFAGESQLAYWHIPSHQSGRSFRVTIALSADLYRVDFYLDPDQVPDNYGELPENIAQYLNSDSLAYITAQVEQLAHELTGHTNNPLVKARNIYRWTIDHLEHQFPVADRGTRALFGSSGHLMQGNFMGDSAEYAWAFVALCRAAGLPARSVTGFLVKTNSELPHTWAEFYLPTWGWVPADPYLADSEEMLLEFSGQADAFYYFGHLDHYHLAFYKGCGFAIEPKGHLSHPPFIAQDQVWFAPIGIWDFDRFPNAGANLSVQWEALLITKFEHPEYGLIINFPTTWHHQPQAIAGPYLLKEKFLPMDKSLSLELLARALPSEHANIDAKTAARLEIGALKQSLPDYQIASEQEVSFRGGNGYELIAKSNSAGTGKWEYRCYIVQPGHLFWLIGTSSDGHFKQSTPVLKSIVRNMEFRWPERFR